MSAVFLFFMVSWGVSLLGGVILRNQKLNLLAVIFACLALGTSFYM